MSDERKFNIEDFDEYIRQGEPDKKEKAYIWQTAIGLQAVDGLQVSDYLRETARKNIEGDITVDEARELVKQYYIKKTAHDEGNEDKEEADRVSANITKILSSETLDFSAKGFIALHRRIFEGVFKHAGKIRDYNITKKEWVLEYDTVRYLNWEDLHRSLEYDIEQERGFSYKGISSDELIAHISRFVSGIWQIHAFGEGNTRTTAVFTILYLRDLGFKVENDMFAQHSWYFRNALVRANYRNVRKGIEPNSDFLELFFRNLLAGEQNELKNRYMLVDSPAEWTEKSGKYPTSIRQVPDKFNIPRESVGQLVRLVGNRQLSVQEMLSEMKLKNRENFLDNYLKPAIADGWIARLYPESPRHPRQKYLLTVKGLSFYRQTSGRY